MNLNNRFKGENLELRVGVGVGVGGRGGGVSVTFASFPLHDSSPEMRGCLALSNELNTTDFHPWGSGGGRGARRWADDFESAEVGAGARPAVDGATSCGRTVIHQATINTTPLKCNILSLISKVMPE